jgi:hypothetical protein
MYRLFTSFKAISAYRKPVYFIAIHGPKIDEWMAEDNEHCKHAYLPSLCVPSVSKEVEWFLPSKSYVNDIQCSSFWTLHRVLLLDPVTHGHHRCGRMDAASQRQYPAWNH